MARASEQHYLIALGSNMRHPLYGAPRAVLAEAMLALDGVGHVLAISRIIASAPLGPSLRTYANAACVIESDLAPADLLNALQGIEKQFGRKKSGQRWRARTLDLDIVLWSGGVIAENGLSVPHPAFRQRRFVLGPAASIAPGWRDPLTGLTLAQLYARLTSNAALPR